MSDEHGHVEEFSLSVEVDQSVRDLRPDYAVLVVEASGLVNAASDEESGGWLAAAAAESLATDHEAKVQSWQEAFRAMGTKPQKFRPSHDALTRRASAGLPTVNKVVDAYNSISVRHGIPAGGENAGAYVGPARLVRAEGTELFETTRDGETVDEPVDAGEVVWRDDKGVTCRWWCWRQCNRTRIQLDTTNMFFVLERLEPVTIDELNVAGEELCELLRTISPSVRLRSTLHVAS